MKGAIEHHLPEHTIRESNATNIYIADYKNKNLGCVELLEQEPDDIKYVHLSNERNIAVYFDGFKENALVIDVGHHSQQCECLLFPTSCNEDDWVLFIECKYAYDLKAATDVKNGYPQKMVDQILATVKFFRDKGILAKERRVTAIVSFPNLVEEFNSTFFSGGICELDIKIQHKVTIIPTNYAKIISCKRLKFSQD